jgi:hypothetical protein
MKQAILTVRVLPGEDARLYAMEAKLGEGFDSPPALESPPGMDPGSRRTEGHMAHGRIPSRIDGPTEIPVGKIGFLTRAMSTNNGGETWSLSAFPLHTNQSHMPRLYGWCGETNNVSRYAEGLALVESQNPYNDRLRIRPVTDPAEIRAALEALDYPELADEIEGG